VSKRTRVPRASLACTMLDDPDAIALLQDSRGREAFALWCALLVAAKSQGNGGDFAGADEVVMAQLVRMPVKGYRAALTTLRDRTDWLDDSATVRIRSWAKWNAGEGSGRGGPRPGAGRPRSVQESDDPPIEPSDVNQTAPLINSNARLIAPSVSVSVSASVPSAQEARACEGGQASIARDVIRLFAPLQADPHIRRRFESPAIELVEQVERLLRELPGVTLEAVDALRKKAALSTFDGWRSAALDPRRLLRKWDAITHSEATRSANGNGHNPAAKVGSSSTRGYLE